MDFSVSRLQNFKTIVKKLLKIWLESEVHSFFYNNNFKGPEAHFFLEI